MTDFNNPRGPDLRDNVNRRSPAAWIGGAIIVILILIGIGYAFNGGYRGGNTVEHRAADVTNPSPAASPSAPAASPAATPPGANNTKQ